MHRTRADPRAVTRLGVSTVGYAGRAKRPPLDEDPAPTNYEVFRLLPGADERFPSDVDIEIRISVSC